MVSRILTCLFLLLGLLCTINLVVSHTRNIYSTDRNQLRLSKSFKSQNGNVNTNLTHLSRSKRVAIYDGLGVCKLVPSFAYPIKQFDKKQSFWWFFNVQGQWVPTTIPLYWWSFWNTTAFVSTAREWRKDMQSKVFHDEARTWVYNAIELGMEQLDGANGGVCLLRSICEISQKPFQSSNIFSEIVNSVMVPSLDNVASKYLHARDAGLGGADCERTYSDCNPLLWTLVTNLAKNPFS
ncbi:uncharacterized protein LOC108116554 [Drosophila eugracilis]|uniref:uncharacterized protein LOC108116554 n=1 Tax=Drosophila eugracilis TaxID=29029 RepID=UPI001BD9BAFD|nr:uncharacterized protein LOC108116554 [Drosophila eugracilis]